MVFIFVMENRKVRLEMATFYFFLRNVSFYGVGNNVPCMIYNNNNVPSDKMLFIKG